MEELTAQLSAVKKEERWTFVCGKDPAFGPGCGQTLTTDERFKSQTGKKIPLEFSYDSVGQIHLEPHKCPVKAEARRNETEKLIAKVESLEGKITGLEYKIDQMTNKMEELMKFFSPNPPQPASEMS